jgi:hypothetical protein
MSYQRIDCGAVDFGDRLVGQGEPAMRVLRENQGGTMSITWRRKGAFLLQTLLRFPAFGDVERDATDA